MLPSAVVESQISAQAFAGRRYAVIGAQIDLFVFDRPPEPFDHCPAVVCIANDEREDIVPPRALAVHADLDVGILQRFDEVDGCKLAALIRVHDLGFAVAAHGVFQSFYARSGFERRRQPPGQNLPAEPVQHSDQIDKATGHALPGRALRSKVPRGGCR